MKLVIAKLREVNRVREESAVDEFEGFEFVINECFAFVRLLI